MLAWGPWVQEMVMMLDGEGTFRHYPIAGGLMDQPARDMLIYNIAREKWVSLMNKRITA
jgi:hypothetical protein